MQRTSLGILRKEIEPASLEVFTAFQLQWQHVAPHAALRGDDAVGRCLEQLQGLDLPAELWEREIIGRRVRGEAGGRLRLLTSAGDVLWAGTGGGRLRQFLRGSGEAFLPATGDESAASLPHGAELVYTTLQTRGALFFQDLRAETGLALAALNRALAHLVWTGLITNDTLDELLRLERAGPGRDAELSARIEILAPHHNPRRAALMQTARKAIRNVPGWSGRWAILRTAGVLGRAITEEERARLQALQLLRRYGVLPREAHRREEFLPWARIAGQLHLMELRGEVRKGYFVRGISGMQYALPEAAEMIRAAAASPIRDELTLLNACDPANPFGPGLEPTTGSISPERWARTPSTSLVFRGGTPLLWCGSRGARITCSEEAADRDVREAVKLFLAHLDASPSPPPRLTIEYWNSVRPTECSRSGVLRELGFRGDRQQMMTRERPV
jgi:ATP-dependent Lhr-like helicase